MSKVDSSWKTWLLEKTVRVFFFRQGFLSVSSSPVFPFQSSSWSISFFASSESLSSSVISSSALSSLASWSLFWRSGERLSGTGDDSLRLAFSDPLEKRMYAWMWYFTDATRNYRLIIFMKENNRYFTFYFILKKKKQLKKNFSFSLHLEIIY